jgi:4-hydroxy-tetrahydrodipicolinate synthase
MFELMKLMFCAPNPTPAKKALELMGTIRDGQVRLPLAPIDDTSTEKIRAAMKKIDLL